MLSSSQQAYKVSRYFAVAMDLSSAGVSYSPLFKRKYDKYV